MEGSLDDEASLTQACQNVNTVLFNVQGGDEVIVDGQLLLSRSAVYVVDPLTGCAMS